MASRKWEMRKKSGQSVESCLTFKDELSIETFLAFLAEEDGPAVKNTRNRCGRQAEPFHAYLGRVILGR